MLFALTERGANDQMSGRSGSPGCCVAVGTFTSSKCLIQTPSNVRSASTPKKKVLIAKLLKSMTLGVTAGELCDSLEGKSLNLLQVRAAMVRGSAIIVALLQIGQQVPPKDTHTHMLHL